jgi:hypothetical protein
MPCWVIEDIMEQASEAEQLGEAQTPVFMFLVVSSPVAFFPVCNGQNV